MHSFFVQTKLKKRSISPTYLVYQGYPESKWGNLEYYQLDPKAIQTLLSSPLLSDEELLLSSPSNSLSLSAGELLSSRSSNSLMSLADEWWWSSSSNSLSLSADELLLSNPVLMMGLLLMMVVDMDYHQADATAKDERKPDAEKNIKLQTIEWGIDFAEILT